MREYAATASGAGVAVSRVFICYRRDDSQGYSGRLYDRLRLHLGDDRVFRDIDKIAGGERWRQVVQRNLADAGAVVALIGPDWAGGDTLGDRRIDDERDPVRVEIEYALTHGIEVVAVLLEDAKMPDEDLLPDSLRDLAAVNAFNLGDRHFDIELDEIFVWIEKALTASPTRGPTRTEPRDYRKLRQNIVIPMGDEVFSVALSPDGVTLAAAAGDRVVILSAPDGPVRSWNEENPPEARDLETAHENLVYAVTFSPDGTLLASADQDGRVQVTDLVRGAELWNRHTHTDAVYSIDFSPDGEELVSGGYDGLVQSWSADGGERIDSKKLGPCSSVAFSPVKGRRVVALGSLDNSVHLWDIDAGSLSSVGPPHASSVEDVAFSSDGRLVASCGLDKAVRVWDLEVDSAAVDARNVHGYLVRSIAFSPDGGWLASASWDKTIRVWDVHRRSQREIRWGRERHTDWIWCVAFSPDGTVLASGASDESIMIWTLPEDAVDNDGPVGSP